VVAKPVRRAHDGSVSVAPETVQASTPTCWCCGAEFDEHDLVRLGSHPEVGVCFGCARYLQRRAAAQEDERGRSWQGRARDVVGAARDWVLARDWHNRRMVGRILRRIDRHLP
jgi:hypothetical protein